MTEPEYKFKKLTAFIFCCYLVWAFFGIDLTINGSGAERLPLHRVFLLITAFVFLCNFRVGWEVFLRNKLLVVLIVYVLLSALWSGDPKEVAKIFVFLMLGFFISIVMAIAYRDDFKSLIRLLFWLSFLMIGSSIVVALFFPKYGVNASSFQKTRWIGITDHPNRLGEIVLIAVWASVNLFFLTKFKIEKVLSILLLIASAITVVKADSMTSIVASLFIIGHLVYIKLITKRSMPFKIILFGLAIFLIAILTTFYMSSNEIVNNSLASTGRDSTLTGRSTLWEKGLKSFAEHPLTGEGFDDLEHLTLKYHIRMSHLHNGYIEILVKGGFIAALLLVLMLVSKVKDQVVISKYDESFYAIIATGTFGVLVHNLAESSLLRGMNGLNLFLMLMLASTSVKLHDVKKYPVV
ncbi:O-antigen ligase family protein [Methylomonas sp. UP202]|uniref:O-antigen ligase family protein n=1 Tax=Methylomonas sp. UP202 TaxID=3040943 RepID=UPI002479B1DD|nr:O-antigen ligase family protein [Methylomonas sp. UP202]WGS86794.1 O-antigen ligase family protein [Methylomonas sp. UP202]